MSEKLTVKQLREIIADLPDDTLVDMFNGGAEWYGVESIVVDSVKEIDGRLVFNFGNTWSAYDNYPDLEPLVNQYRRERGV